MKINLNTRLYIILSISIICFILIIYQISNIMLFNKEKFNKMLSDLTINVVEGTSVPRGRIYDRNYNLLVDNVGVKTIYYKREKGTSTKDLINIIKLLKDNIEIDTSNISDRNLKEYYIVLYEDEANKLVTEDELNSYKERKISSTDLLNIKLDRITNEELNKIDKEEAYLYYLMTKGYYYDENIIKTYATEEEYAFVASNVDKLKGVNVKLEWERKYLYGDTFRTILGNISNSSSGIPKELKDYYLSKGYSLNDKVGVSYLEYQYEDILKGEKPVYKLNDDNSYSIIKEGIRGNDIVLTIDINIQKEVEQILKEEVVNAKLNNYNTEYYDGSHVIVVEPSTGEILAFSSIFMLEKNGEISLYDNSPALLTNPVTPGSMVKGASISTGFKEGVIEPGTTFMDECVKIQNTPEKCSWISGIGVVNDVEALAISSNVYQYKTAMRVAKANYYYNGPLVIDETAFDKYRSMFKEYGLGEKTNIDLPVESEGVIGTKKDAGLLLDLSIGQYDSYTPIQIASYISTIAMSGDRYQLHFLKEIRNPSDSDEIGTLKEKIEPKLVHKVDLDPIYMSRIREGFSRVMDSTGYDYMGDIPYPSGKTGSAETFKDTDNDGNIDTETLSKGFVGYAPSDNPRFSMVILSPNVKKGHNNDYTSPVNYKISKRVASKVFEFLQ
ncbi:MAG: penicillin-binding protein 2 [Bacilli bacterium]|nr:penicillin-binding protein 2 [Bacilli bacterium]